MLTVAKPVKKVVGYSLMAIGGVLVVPAWCAMGEGSIYSAVSYVSMPAWLLAVVGLGLVGLGNFIQGPSLAERRAKREAEASAFQERLAKARAYTSHPRYKELRQRKEELDAAADHADEVGNIARRDAFRDEAFAVWKQLKALEDEVYGSS
jgi:hypothetical protein